MIKAVLFDFDGTIADTLPLVVSSIQKTVESFLQKKLSYEEVAEVFGPCEEGSILKLVPENYVKACELFYKYYVNDHDMCSTPYNSIVDLIKMLKKEGILVGLVTGKGRRTTKISLKKYHMMNIFDVIKTGSLQKSMKVECIKEVLDEYFLKPCEAFYIGDMPSDIDSARKAGIKIISVMYSTLLNEADIKIKSPDKICYIVNELVDYLKTEIGKRER